MRQGGNTAVALLASVLLPHAAAGQTTRAEATGFRTTSSYTDVMSFLDSLQRRTSDLSMGTLATSTEGRRIPFAVVARPLVSTPGQAQRSGKPIIYLQANIHAGEVEGKEAAQMLLRDLSVGNLRPLLERVVLLVVPIYNPDGNERWGPGERNRPGQNGPEPIGRNQNGQGLNLNRDYVKLEAPETRGSVSLIRAWDPDVFIDLHTTNGSYHGYVLTYAPGLNPNATPAASFVRDRLLPVVRARMLERHAERTFSYGNFRNQSPDSLKLGWETYDARPRFGTNWMGLRGRLAVLSEGYSNADFRTRVHATYDFVLEVLQFLAEQRQAIKSLVSRSDRYRPDSVAIRSVLARPIIQDVVAELTRDLGEGNGGYARRQRTGVYRTIRMPVYDSFTAERKEAMPAAYLIPERLREVVGLLRSQGILVEAITGRGMIPVQVFTVDSLSVQPLFEGHRPVQAEGSWKNEPLDTLIGQDWYAVRSDQPLGTLAAYLLEPASEDGLVTWNLLDRELQDGGTYPILRARGRLLLPSIGIP